MVYGIINVWELYVKFIDENWFHDVSHDNNKNSIKCKKILCDKFLPSKLDVHYRKYVDKTIELKLWHSLLVKTDVALIKDEIYYDSGKIFYDGTFTLYGNKFGIGKFYYEDSTLMYEKFI